MKDLPEYLQLESIQLIMDNTQELIWAIDLNYCLLFGNKSYFDAVKATGGKNLGVGKSVFTNEYPDKELQLWKSFYDKALEGEQAIDTFELLWPDGIHSIENTIKPLKDDTGKIVGALIICYDYTEKNNAHILAQENEKKLTETNLKLAPINERLIVAKEKAEEREKYLSVIYENSGLSIFVVNVLEDGTFVYEGINPTHEAMMNIKNSEIAGRTPDEMVYHFGQETINYVNAFYSECVQNRKTIESEFYIPEGKAKGWWLSRLTPIINEKTGTIVKLIGGSIDISERKNTEIELLKAKELAEENEEKFKILYESLSIAYLIIKDGVCIDCNEATQIIYGVESRDDIIGKSPIDFSPEFQPDNKKSSEEATRHIQMAIEKGFHTFEWLAMRKNKETFYAEVSLKKFYYKNELYIQCLTTDISERKRIEAELIAAKERAEKNESNLLIKNEEYETINEELRQTNLELINAKEEIEESESKFRNLYEALSITYIILKDGICFDCNEAALAIHGVKSKDEFIGKSPVEFSPEFQPNNVKSSEATAKNMQIAIEKGFHTFEWLSMRKNKETFYAEVSLKKFYYKNELYIQCLTTDISERKRIEAELIAAKEQSVENEIFLRTLINTLPDLVWLKDINGVYLKCNKRFEDFFGATEQEIIGKTDYDFMDNNLAGFFRRKDKDAIEAGKPTMNEELITFAKDHHSEYLETLKTPFFIHDELVGVLGIGRNITERKNAELELLKAKEKVEESEGKFKNLYEALSTAYLIIKDGVCVECNEAALTIYGVKSKDEIIGKPPTEFSPEFQPNNIKSTDEAIRQTQIAFERGFHTFEWLGMRKNKELFYNEVSLKKFYYKNELYLQCLTTDITLRKKVEDELIKAKEKAEESDKLKTAFLQNMSHEIRTPLNAISGFSGILNKPDLSEEKRKNFVSIIQSSSKQLISVVTDILTISSLETRQEKANLNKTVINKILADLHAVFNQQAISQNVSLYLKQQLNDEQSEIYTDKTKLTQLLSNLLSNALKFTHEGFVEFGYTLVETLHATSLQFYVKDSGIGIKSEFQEKIFERFRQADNSINKLYGGTGLGLSISKAFVELLGGKIWVQSEFEKGSTFYFTIPYKPVKEININTSSAKQNEHFKTIIVAEDEEYNFLLIKELLDDYDLKLIHTKNGNETVETFKANPIIDLILMDIKMPIMTGYEAARIIKSIKPDLPIVAQTAYALQHERAQFKEIFNDYIVKPINEDDLKQIVMKYIKIE
jgi:PAS domain S-box-containing protein